MWTENYKKWCAHNLIYLILWLFFLLFCLIQLVIPVIYFFWQDVHCFSRLFFLSFAVIILVVFVVAVLAVVYIRAFPSYLAFYPLVFINATYYLFPKYFSEAKASLTFIGESWVCHRHCGKFKDFPLYQLITNILLLYVCWWQTLRSLRLRMTLNAVQWVHSSAYIIFLENLKLALNLRLSYFR